MKHLKTYENNTVKDIETLLSKEYIEKIFKKYGYTCKPSDVFRHKNFIIYEIDTIKEYDYLIRCRFSVYDEDRRYNLNKIDKYTLQKINDELGSEKFWESEDLGGYQRTVYFYINYDDCGIKLIGNEFGLL